MNGFESQDSLIAYENARKIAMRVYHKKVSMGQWGTLPTLDAQLQNVEIVSKVNLPTMEIPLKKIIGTNTNLRSNTFASNFMPLPPTDSEFAVKWIKLCTAHLMDGIKDSIQVYEYLNWFFVIEGNKRVSVLKYFNADSITGKVMRLIPKWDENNQVIRNYYAFMEFNKRTGINGIWFSNENSFEKLYSHIESLEFSVEDYINRHPIFMESIFLPFRKVYYELKGNMLPLTTGDAYLEFIRLFGRPDSYESDELKDKISKLLLEVQYYADEEINIAQSQPSQKDEGVIISGFKTVVKKVKAKKLKVAFVYAKSAEESKWTYSHEQGRIQVQEALGGQVSTCYVDNIPECRDAYESIKKLALEGNNVIFSTSPEFFDATLRAALEFKKVKFFSCSMMHSYKYVRTYYGRIFEPAFLAGLIAGLKTRTDLIGFIGSHKSPEVVSIINAFALGASMVNPRAKVMVEWTGRWDLHKMSIETGNKLLQIGADVFYQQYIFSSAAEGESSSLYTMACTDDKVNISNEYIATAVWNWGVFYSRILEDILEELSISNKNGFHGGKFVSYWWGLESGVVDFKYSKEALTVQAQKLIEHFKKMISEKMFNPFEGPLYDHCGQLRIEATKVPHFDDFLAMDWFVDGVEELKDLNGQKEGDL